MVSIQRAAPQVTPGAAAIRTSWVSRPNLAPEESDKSGLVPVSFNWQPQDTTVLPGSAKPIAAAFLDSDGCLSTGKVKLAIPLTPLNGNYVYPDDDARHVQSVAFANAAAAADTMCKAFDIHHWAGTDQPLSILADTGPILFANSSGGKIRGGHLDQKVAGKTVYALASGDVMAHEIGHAIFAALRPGLHHAYFPEVSRDVEAFDESFSDIIAMHMALCDDAVVAKLVQQTDGDLSKDNLVANIGEELNVGLSAKAGKSPLPGAGVRSANNRFTWVEPSSLPTSSDELNLSSERHSLSQVWTGAHYDILQGLINQKIGLGLDAVSAIQASNQEALSMLVNLMKEAPEKSFSLEEMAQQFVISDQKYSDGRHAALLKTVLSERNLITEAGLAD